MNQTAQNFTEDDLHAYVDGQLTSDQEAQVAAWLEANPEAAEIVAKWQVQNDELRAMFAPYATDEPLDLLQNPQPRPVWLRHVAMIAGAALIFGLGAISGHYGGPASAPDTVQTAQSLPQQAQDAYLIYASEVRHPVEVYAEEHEHLAAWLGKRLESDNLKIPDLQSLGFSLVGGRLVPLDGKPGAMFMYQNQSGERVTIMVRRDKDNKTTSFRSASSGRVETFYWVDGDFGYAVTGEIPRASLQSIANEIYQQLET